MIDILYSYNQNGPGKVISNLKKGLELLGVQYRENPNDVSTDSKAIALQWHNNISKYQPENILIGPNICTLPIDNEFVMSQNYKKIIVPSEWVKDLYNKWIPSEKIIVWPVGIDTEYFSDKSKDDKFFDCLIYYKRRSYDELNFVKKLLREFNQNFDIVEYGSYSEIGFLEKLSKSRYVFVLDSCESQGIAIQEIMSSNIPLFVWDMEFWEDRGHEYKIEATSVPFWDDVCGIKEKNKDLIFESFSLYLENINSFKPREYVLNELMLKKQAEYLISFFN